MKLVTLTPKNGHEKNRIRQHGSVWEVVGEEHDRFLLRSLGKTFRGGEHDLRWADKAQCVNKESE